MAIDTIRELLKNHQELLERNRPRLDAVREGGRLPPEEVRKQKDEEIAALRERLTETAAARRKALERYDSEIQRLKDDLARLEEGGKKVDEVLSGKPRPIAKPKAKASGAKKERVGRKK